MEGKRDDCCKDHRQTSRQTEHHLLEEDGIATFVGGQVEVTLDILLELTSVIDELGVALIVFLFDAEVADALAIAVLVVEHLTDRGLQCRVALRGLGAQSLDKARHMLFHDVRHELVAVVEVEHLLTGYWSLLHLLAECAIDLEDF